MWGFWMKFVATPVIVIVGIVGNALSLVVMKTQALRHKSYSHYLCALAVFDTLTLVMRQVRTVDEFQTSVLYSEGVFRHFSSASCKAFNFIEHVCYLMSSWVIVLMSVERLVAVCLPFRQSVIRRQSGAVISICIALAVVGISQVFRIIMIQNHSGTCAASDNYVSLYSSLQVYFYQVTLTFVLPVLIILTCNVLVLYQIFRVQKAIKERDYPDTRYRRVVNKRHRTTCMLLIVSFTYIITLLPLFTLSMIIDSSVKLRGPDAWELYKAMSPFLEVASAISLINYAINFFIYILSGKSFRFELRKVFQPERNQSVTAATRTREEFIRL